MPPTGSKKPSLKARINRASDDAAGLAIADSLNARSRIFNQGVRNLNDGLSLLSIADSAIETLSGIMIRLEELAEQSANGVYTNDQRQSLDAEAQALGNEFFRVSKTAAFNGQRLFTGEFQVVNLQAGVGNGAVLSAGVGGAIGTGRFDSAENIGVSAGASDLAIGDFNGDGVTDIVAGRSNGNVNVLVGQEGGGFTLNQSFALSGNIIHSVVAGDFNNDGVLDFAVDGEDDRIVVAFLGTGSGSFQQGVSYSLGFTPRDLAGADLNGDGLEDLVAVGDGGAYQVLLATGDGTFNVSASVAIGSSAEDVAVGEFNGDGLLDLAISGYASVGVRVLLGAGNGTFSTSVSFGAFTTPEAVVTADFNGDGIDDIAATNYSDDTLRVLLANGDGTFQADVSYTVGDYPLQVVSRDFNGDGAADIVVGNVGDNTVSVLLGTGGGTFGSATDYSGGSVWALATADINQDGVSDLLTGGTYISVLNASVDNGVAPLLPFSLKTLADARQALPVFKCKREQLAAQRGEIGAFQRRIGVAANVLTVSSENFKAAESRIRDADIAEESSKLVRLNILQQAASSVLVQANQQPALALQLLTGR